MKLFVWDTETTGINPKTDSLVEIAAIEVEGYAPLSLHGVADWAIKNEFRSYVNPERDIPPEAKAVHHITEKMVVDAPKAKPAVLSMLDYLGVEAGDVFVAHNARFDRGFLRTIAPTIDDSLTHICTMKCAKVIWPDANGYSNQYLRYWLNLDPPVPAGMGPHSALYDITVTAAILFEELKHKSLDELIQISKAPVLLKKMPMGKHQGMTFDKVPRSYLQWILDQAQGSFDEDLIYTAKHWYNKFRGY